jgi:hypothetical protein
MQQMAATYLPQQWSEAHRRAEIYLRALRSEFGSAERQLVARALASAREQHRRGAATHPVTLVMESLFEMLPPQNTMTPITMTPPLARASMLPEKTEFPLHDWLRRGGWKAAAPRIFRGRIFAFAEVR